MDGFEGRTASEIGAQRWRRWLWIPAVALLAQGVVVPPGWASDSSGYATAGFERVDGEHVLMLVDERFQGQTDLNGDGDETDLVVHVWDRASATVVNLGIAVERSVASHRHLINDWGVVFRSGIAAVLVSEAEQGTDLNNDLDESDHVLHVWQPGDAAPTNLGLAVSDSSTSVPLTISDSALMFGVEESAQGGTDINGDGLVTDAVIHVWRPTQGLESLGIRTSSTFNGIFPSRADGSLFVFRSIETSGETDFNGDGDASDEILFAWDAATGTLVDSDLSVQNTGAYYVDSGIVLVTAYEADDGPGGTDYNGDNDRNDFVAHLWDPSTGATVNGMVAGTPEQRQPNWSGPLGDGSFLLRVVESRNGPAPGTDYNGDSDVDDSVAFVWAAGEPLPTNLQVAFESTSESARGDGVAAFTVSEADQGGSDLNGDTDTTDQVLHVWTAADGLRNVGLAAFSTYGPATSGGVVGFLVQETAQGGLDRNRDGDSSDAVVAAYDTRTDAVENLQLAAVFSEPIQTADGAIVFVVDEGAQDAGDLNGDGSTLGLVPHKRSITGDVTLVPDAAVRLPVLYHPPGILFRVDETDVDLNGDMDTSDVVLQVYDPGATAVDDAYAVDEDDELIVGAADGVLANDTDEQNDPITAVLVSDVTDGTLTLDGDGSFVYRPSEDFNGEDSFTYVANDGVADSNVATVTITVTPVNDAPEAVDDAYVVDEDGELLIGAAAGVLANDTDVDGDALTAMLASNVSSGTLALDGDGSFTYRPPADFAGDATFTYVATDGAADSTVATVTITVTPVNDAPVATDDTYTVDEDGELIVAVADGVLANDTDAEDDPITAVLVSDVTNGTSALNADGSFTYRPDEDFNGQDSFTYVATDGLADSEAATVTITVVPVNDAPVAVDDVYRVDNDEVLIEDPPGVLANDIDVDGDAMVVSLVTDVAHGSLTLDPDGSFIYDPDDSHVGLDTFAYIAGDGLADSAPATVTIDVADAGPIVSIADAAPVVESSGETADFLVWLDVASDDPVTVEVTTSDGTATSGGDPRFGDADYEPVATTATIPAGSISTTVSVVVNDDLLEEDDETFSATISAAVGADLGVTSASATILDDADVCTQVGTEGPDELMGTGADDVLCGLGGDDVLVGLAGSDTLLGGAGDDRLEGGTEDDVLDGDGGPSAGPGTDVADFTGSATAVDVDLIDGRAAGEGNDVLIAIEDLDGSSLGDRLEGDDGPNRISGNGGNDVVNGRGGDDELIGGSDAPGASGPIPEPGDRVSFAGAPGGVTVDLEAGTATGWGTDTVQGFENVFGTAFGDRIEGNARDNRLFGDAGNDVVNGRAGNDALFGGTHTETSAGPIPEPGDRVSFAGAPSGVDVDLSLFAATGWGTDSVVGFENVFGSAYGDRIVGNDQDNRLFGAAGDDTVDGRGGNDRIFGGVGDDTARGGDGKDLVRGDDGNDDLAGEGGRDKLFGGAGSDEMYGGADRDLLNDGVGSDHFDGGPAQDVCRAADGGDTFVSCEQPRRTGAGAAAVDAWWQ